MIRSRAFGSPSGQGGRWLFRFTTPPVPAVTVIPTVDGWLPYFPDRAGLAQVLPPGLQSLAFVEALEQLPVPGPLAWRPTHPDVPSARARASFALDPSFFAPTTVPVAPVAPLDSWAPEFSDRPAAAARVRVVADQASAFISPPELFVIPGPTAWAPTFPARPGPALRSFAGDPALALVVPLAQLAIPGLLAWRAVYPDRAAPPLRSFALDLATAPPQALAQFAGPRPDAWLARYPDQPTPPAIRSQAPWFAWNTLTPGQVVVPPLDSWSPAFPGRPAAASRLAQAGSAVLVPVDTALFAWRPAYPILGRQEATSARLAPHLALPPFVQPAPAAPALSWLALFPPGSRAAAERSRADFPWVSFEAFLAIAPQFPGVVVGAVNVTLLVGPFGAVLLVPASLAASAGAHAGAAASAGAGQGSPSLQVTSPARTSSGPATSSPSVVVGGPGGKVGATTTDGQTAGARGSGAAGSGDEDGSPSSTGTKGSNPKVT